MMGKQPKPPNPGSDEAVRRNCTCPILDNRRGLGYYAAPDGCHIINENCPLHGAEAREARKAARKAARKP